MTDRPGNPARTESAVWISPDPLPAVPRAGPAGWARIFLRLPVMLSVLLGGLILLLVLRLAERPLFGLRRPWTPFITQAVCRVVLAVLGLRLQVRGRPMRGRGAIVANHASWLDILVINALQRVYFVSKSEVARWPGIGWLARATGTVFINRTSRDARLQKEIFEARLRAGHHLCFFPEGTSTDGRRVLGFKPTLFAAFFAHGLADILQVQPVSVVYDAPNGQDARFYAWWGDMAFGPHLLQLAAAPRRGRVTVVLHPPVGVAAAGDRKSLARICEQAVRAGLEAGLPRPRAPHQQSSATHTGV
ncbi:MAG: lyso-ornithine lipid O-acyltransferase [Pararhodobacter sp.]